jgi:hypothetical protein
MNKEIATELIAKLKDDGVTLKCDDGCHLRVSNKNEFFLTISDTDIISLFKVENKQTTAIFSIKMMDMNYSIQDALCLAYQGCDGKDIFNYLKK